MIVSKVLEFSAPFGRSASVLQSIRVSAASIANGDSSTTTSTTTTSSTAVTPTPDTPSTISSNGTHHTHSTVQINQEGDDTTQGTLDSTDHNCSSDSLDTGSVASSSSTAAPLPTLFFELARDEPRSLYHIIKTAITSTAFSENAGWTDQGSHIYDCICSCRSANWPRATTHHSACTQSSNLLFRCSLVDGRRCNKFNRPRHSH